MQAEADFEAAWQAGSVAGWEDRGNSQGPSTSGSMASSSGIDLDAFDSVEELVTIGESFKSERMGKKTNLHNLQTWNRVIHS